MSISKRAIVSPPSPIRRLSPLAQEAKAKGLKVLHLNIGQPDIVSPPEFFEGIRAYSAKTIEYEPSSGNQKLKVAWSKFMNAQLGLNTSAEDFLITVGASEALVFAFAVACDPGDEIIILDPTYANYMGFAAASGVNLVAVETSFDNDFAVPELEKILAKLSSKTRAILLCNPNNPTGTVYTKKELEVLTRFCEERGLFFLVDETYREFIYDGSEPLSVLHFAPDSESVVIIDSLSKRFSLCGARVGCLLTKNKVFLEAASRIAQARLAAPSIEQEAAAYMLEKISPDFILNVRQEYKIRRDCLYEELSRLPGVTAHKPQGAFYTLVRLPVADAEGFAKFLLTQFSHQGETVFVAPANGFFMQSGAGLDLIRIAYVLASSEIKRAVRILGLGLEEYKNR